MRSPLCNQDELRQELLLVIARKARLADANIIAPHRAADLRATLNRQENDLRQQIAETAVTA